MLVGVAGVLRVVFDCEGFISAEPVRKHNYRRFRLEDMFQLMRRCHLSTWTMRFTIGEQYDARVTRMDGWLLNTKLSFNDVVLYRIIQHVSVYPEVRY